MIITVKLLPFKNPGYEVGLPLITIKWFFFNLEKYNKLLGNCQGILN